MIELKLTYLQATTLFDFLSIRLEVVGEHEPEIKEIRDLLLMEKDNYEQSEIDRLKNKGENNE
ncbi:hypothetical protein I8751_13690 [Nostocaceae cyanobacterium CENA357]|uniref:Uncharacterized protein n=1 Tax=Atlanticothrix silvestris CENA357 TaxID=1725252 RepID=A0A8J7HEM0_9CYAN|nr:hypothetical protein [Atlanticothrix silvestris]MBH8553408.1 hypothetical protein [Atlanticothrix silvestris CENA357]